MSQFFSTNQLHIVVPLCIYSIYVYCAYVTVRFHGRIQLPILSVAPRERIAVVKRHWSCDGFLKILDRIKLIFILLSKPIAQFVCSLQQANVFRFTWALSPPTPTPAPAPAPAPAAIRILTVHTHTHTHTHTQFAHTSTQSLAIINFPWPNSTF